MSRTTTARRIALLSSSSLSLAAIVTAAAMGASLTPTAAQAQVATCTVGATPQAGANVIIPAGTHNPNITCVYTGDTATVSTAGSITVSTAAPGGGINLSAAGTDDIRWVSTAGTVTGGAQTNGPVIDARTASGDITLTTANVSPNSASGSDGIYAQATGAGDITMTVGSVSYGIAAGSTALEAVSGGGDIAITANGSIGINFNNVAASTADHDGLVATTSGAGAVSLTFNGSVTGYGTGGAAIRATSGTGGVSITSNGFNSPIRGGNFLNNNSAHWAAGIVIDTTGDATITASSLIMGGINSTGVRAPAIVADAAEFTFTMSGNAARGELDYENYASLGGHPSGGLGGIGGPGPSPELPSNVNRMAGVHSGGHIDLSGVTDGATLNFDTRSRWVVTDTSLLSAGADTVNIDATSILMTLPTGPGSNSASLRNSDFLIEDVDQTLIPPGVIDFGAGADTLNNAGRIYIGLVQPSSSSTPPPGPPDDKRRRGVRGELQLLGLERFVNSGEIWLGVYFLSSNTLFGTDRWADDMLYAPGATFHGEGGSRIFMDVSFNRIQSSCAPEDRDENGWLISDCVGLQGGAATGRTELVIYDLVPGDRGAYMPDGTVLIDLAGSNPEDTDPDAFFLSPEIPGYSDRLGVGAIEKGLFIYSLAYDPEAQQFKLFSLPGSGVQQFPMLATAANQLWRTATGGWFDRRVNQRDVDRGEGLGTGAWFNVSAVGASRDISTNVAFGLRNADFDNSYEQNDVALNFGWDLINHSNAAGSFMAGAMVGYAQSQIDFEGSNTANLEGVHAGVYGGYEIGGFFLDAAVNSAWLSLHNDVPELNLTPAGTLLGTDVQAIGGQIEAGWRWRWGPMSITPLVGLSAVSTDFDEMRIPNEDPDVNRPGGVVRLDAADSRRVSAGVRFTADELISARTPVSLNLTARAVNEMEGEARIAVANAGGIDAPAVDVLDGAFTQLTGGVTVSNASRTIFGHLNLDAMMGDDFQSFGVSTGVRLQW